MLKKAALNLLFHTWKQGGFSVLFWDGDQKNYGKETPTFTIIFYKEPQITITEDLILTLGEAYMDGIIDIEGPIEELLRVLFLNSLSLEPVKKVYTNNFIKKSTSGTQTEQQNIHHHYDIGNDFFSLWLDDTMNYSCGYFKTSQDSLQQAQLRKMDHILRKLNLKPNETLLDIGSGWGGLILHAAQHYQVKATGITLSTDQYNYTQQRIQELGLKDRVNVRLLNYQSIDATQMHFDKIVSVGMFEHVGQDNLSLYLDKISDLLSPGGLFLLHSITGMFETTANSWMGKYIFPGGYVPSLRETIWISPEHHLHLLQGESLRLHYALTLECWYENFIQHIDVIKQKYDDRFIRMWTLYLRGCAAAFRGSGLDIYQLLFSKGLNNHIPLTYDHVYSSR